MRVEFTNFVKNELQKIYNYYSSVASDKIVLKIIDRILVAVGILERLPNSGSKEPLLSTLKNNYRYLVCGNYKIIFYSTNKVTYVTDVFDARQNPEKITKRNK